MSKSVLTFKHQSYVHANTIFASRGLQRLGISTIQGAIAPKNQLSLCSSLRAGKVVHCPLFSLGDGTFDTELQLERDNLVVVLSVFAPDDLFTTYRTS